MNKPSSPSSVAETWLTIEPEDVSDASEPDSKPDALIGMVLRETYRIERVIGEGGMGRIYEARHTRIGDKRYAIKVLLPEYISRPKVRARFEREVEAIARIDHPGVLSIVDVGVTPSGSPYMVSEYLAGLDLMAYLRRFGALHTDRVVHIGARIAEALEAAHAQDVIHRDIKPSNVFLLGAFEPFGPEWDRVKIIDFGLSRLMTRDDHLTEAGMVMGTPAYMSPEQAQALGTDRRTDVYGVGAVLYAAATGVPPFKEETPQQTLLAVMGRDPVPPSKLKSSVSPGLERIILRAMAKRPEDRYASMAAMRLALGKLELRTGLASSGTRTLSGEEGLPGNPGRLARWLPRLRALAFHALVLYGLASLFVRLGDEALTRFFARGAGDASAISQPTDMVTLGNAPAEVLSVSSLQDVGDAGFAPLDARPIDLDELVVGDAPQGDTLQPSTPVAVTAPSAPLVASAAPANDVSPAPAAPVAALPSPIQSLKDRLAAQAARGAMLDAVQTAEQLLGLSMEAAADPEVRRVLTRAANTEGDASRAALELMSKGMGSAGPDMLYDLMLTRPSLFKRARFKLSRFRVRPLFSPELAVAYDLRFAATCGGRMSLLKQANEVGDQRSINVLSALAGKFPRCGRNGRSHCLPLCPKESEELSRSIDTITRRLRGGDRTASVN
jgi:tRNA A-37 threonylcarbamoyl transferase component Bud32